MPRILTLQQTIPSASHNAPCSAELGAHWPAGTRFRRLAPREERRVKARWPHADRYTAVVQIGGEEVIVLVPTEKMPLWFDVPAAHPAPREPR